MADMDFHKVMARAPSATGRCPSAPRPAGRGPPFGPNFGLLNTTLPRRRSSFTAFNDMAQLAELFCHRQAQAAAGAGDENAATGHVSLVVGRLASDIRCRLPGLDVQ